MEAETPFMVSQQCEASTPAAANMAADRKPTSAIMIRSSAGSWCFSMMVLREESGTAAALKAVVQMPDMASALQYCQELSPLSGRLSC